MAYVKYYRKFLISRQQGGYGERKKKIRLRWHEVFLKLRFRISSGMCAGVRIFLASADGFW